MSDTLVDLVSQWQQHLQLILPVAGAIVLVIVVYMCGIGSTPPPSLILAEEPVATKKEKALAKKKLRQQQVKKAKPSNGHVVEAPTSPVPVQPEAVNTKTAATSAKKSSKSQDKKSTAKDKVLAKSAKAAPVRDEKQEAALSAARQERAQMKKEAQQGEWVTVVSSKDKKAKQAQLAVEEASRLDEAAKQAIIDEAKRLTEEAEANNKKASSTKSGKKSKSDDSVKSGDKPSKSSKSKNSNQELEKSDSSPAASIPKPESKPAASAQADVKPKDSKPASPGSGDAPVKDSEQSLQEKIAEAMEPAFDEMGDWEEAKPMKQKNVKKRARRDK